MNISVVFNNKSEEYVFKPLVEKLGQFSNVRLEQFSKDLVFDNDDFIIVCAGLSTHIAQVIIQETSTPVLGLPVETELGGIDSLISMMQTQFGNPVAVCAPEESQYILKFLESISKLDTKKINLVVNSSVQNYEYAVSELNRTIEFAKDNSIEITQSELEKTDVLNIHLVTERSEVSQTSLNIPLLEKTFKDNPYKITEIFDWVKEGGLWFGINNTRNALLFALNIANRRN